MTFAFILIGLCVAVVLIWNFVPAVRDKLKGWSTVLETLMAGTLYAAGVIGDAIKEAQAAGYIPSQWLGYVPYILMAWVLLKRFQTKTPVGKK